MFEIFSSVFRLDDIKHGTSDSMMDSDLPMEVVELFRQFQGASFENGLYRILTRRKSKSIVKQVRLAFPKFSENFICFAADWLGRVFAVETISQDKIFMFEPGTAQVLEIPCSIEKFHAEELIQYKEEALALSFYREWLEAGGAVPDQDYCISYKRPLYLGGIDKVENLEMANMDIYWEISSQLIRGTSGLPIGSPIEGIQNREG